MSKSNKDSVSEEPVDQNVFSMMGQGVVKDGVYWCFPSASLPDGTGFPPGIINKSAKVYIMTSGSVVDGREYRLVMAERVDYQRSRRIFVIDPHPMVTYRDLTTNTLSPTGMIWHHAHPPHTPSLPTSSWGLSIPDTVSILRSQFMQPVSGFIRGNLFLETAMTKTIATLVRYEQKRLKSTLRR